LVAPSPHADATAVAASSAVAGGVVLLSTEDSPVPVIQEYLDTIRAGRINAALVIAGDPSGGHSEQGHAHGGSTYTPDVMIDDDMFTEVRDVSWQITARPEVIFKPVNGGFAVTLGKRAPSG
jgi:hypothetical protein